MYDWVGRNLAEAQTSKASHCIDLTYGRDEAGEVLHERSVLLSYLDVQHWLKRLRRAGYPSRYFVTGEYGSWKGRAHWHVCIHWQKKVPVFEDYRERIIHPSWPHGFMWVRPPTLREVRYVCKYIQKAQGPRGLAEVVEQPRMSKKPPLGARYFADLAAKMVAQGVVPQDLNYTFPGVLTGKPGAQRPLYFRLRERSAELYLEAWLRAWRERHGAADYPRSDLLRNYESYGRVIYDEESMAPRVNGIAQPYNWRDYGARPLSAADRQSMKAPPRVPDEVRDEQLREAQERESREKSARYFNHQWKWLDESDVNREIEKRFGNGKR